MSLRLLATLAVLVVMAAGCTTYRRQPTTLDHNGTLIGGELRCSWMQQMSEFERYVHALVDTIHNERCPADLGFYYLQQEHMMCFGNRTALSPIDMFLHHWFGRPQETHA